MSVKSNDVEQLEIDLLLQSLSRRYGYDFRSYSQAHIKRRILGYAASKSFARISDLIPALLWDETLAFELIREFSITVTSMFRDPEYFQLMRKHVIPILRTYPYIKIWHAGCATGEEVYSMAIVLAEEGLSERATIYGTDFNDEALSQARKGIFDIDKASDFSEGYRRSGGRESFTDYVHAKYGHVTLSERLKANVLFTNHNLVTDGVFGEMHLIVCRNVLIYFDQTLKERTLGLFTDSLVRGGFLCLGARETMSPAVLETSFQQACSGGFIYRKRIGKADVALEGSR